MAKKGKIVSLILVCLTVLFLILDSAFFHHNLIWGFDGILFVLIVLSMVLVAGFVVIKSLLHVAAGLSLLIFLAQSYCAVPSYTLRGDTALKGLLIVGLAYIAVDFVKILYKSLREDQKNITSFGSFHI